MKRRIFGTISVLCLVLVSLLACSAVGGNSGNGPVVVGAIYNLTGAQAELDVASARGAQLAVDEANATGGVLGRQVELVTVDGETNPDVLADKTAALLRDRPETSALLGLSDTDMVLGAAGAAAAADRVFVTSGATSPLLPDQVPQWLFLACFGDNVQAAAAAEYAYNDLGARNALVFYATPNTFTELLQRYFSSAFGQLGGRVVEARPFDPAAGLGDLSGALPAIDVVFLAAPPEDAVSGVTQLREAGFGGPIMGGDSFDIGTGWAAAANESNVYFTTHAYIAADNTDPRVVAFRQAFEKANPGAEPNAFAALGYDAARLVLAAIEAAGSTDPEAVRQALAGIEGFEGVTGTISFRAGARIPTKSVSILRVTAGGLGLARQITPAAVPAP